MAKRRSGVMRNLLKSSPVLVRAVKVLRRVRLAIACSIYDARHNFAHMRWDGNEARRDKLSYQLIFYYHKIEKGLCLPGKPRFFGLDAIDHVVRLMDLWNDSGFPHDAVYRAAQATLHAYRLRLEKTPPPDAVRDNLYARLDRLLSDFQPQEIERTPIAHRPVDPATYGLLRDLAFQRRSVRNFDGRPVDREQVQRAIEIGMLSPSACNRQPWKIHLFDQRDKIDALLKLQNGNTGFGGTVPLLALIAVDSEAFFDESERIEPALDGGLFLMSFILALNSQGVASCCLNWCVPPATDKAMRAIARLPGNQRVLTYLAIGHASPDAIVPLSGRRPLAEVMAFHE